MVFKLWGHDFVTDRDGQTDVHGKNNVSPTVKRADIKIFFTNLAKPPVLEGLAPPNVGRPPKVAPDPNLGAPPNVAFPPNVGALSKSPLPEII